MKSPKDPVDHARTTRPHAGESMTDSKNMPALAVLGLSLVAFISCLAAFGTGNHAVGVILAVIAGIGFAAAGLWLLIEHWRVRKIEERWHAEHPDAERQTPNS